MLDHSADDWGSAELHSDPEADPSARVIAIVAKQRRAPDERAEERDRQLARLILRTASPVNDATAPVGWPVPGLLQRRSDGRRDAFHANGGRRLRLRRSGNGSRALWLASAVLAMPGPAASPRPSIVAALPLEDRAGRRGAGVTRRAVP
jgi:hypothetical protein